jgi:acyl-[acyl carrier protein]--UDP-N-acetylglucosamine O-acyltransferase
VDETAPWLVTIGNNVSITHGVIILTHDYSWSVIKTTSGEILGAMSPVKIGNNVFLGMNAIILKGVTINDNVIIGAGSVVAHDCEEGWVYAGNPAKKVMPIQQYAEKRRQKQFAEAKRLAVEYRARFNTTPPIEMFKEYFQLFCTEEAAKAVPDFCGQMVLAGTYDDCASYMREVRPMFDGFASFLCACYEEESTLDQE